MKTSALSLYLAATTLLMSSLGSSGQTAITYLDSAGHQQIYFFVGGAHLRVLKINSFAGPSWQWQDLGAPPNLAVGVGVDSVSAVTYRGGVGLQLISVFCAINGRLWVDRFDGLNWSWMDLGLPPDNHILEEVSAVTYTDAAGLRHFFVCGRPLNGGPLWVDRSDGLTWHWEEHSTAPVGYVTDPVALTYRPVTGNQRFLIFCRSADGHLWINWFDGLSWHWDDQGGVTGVDFITPVTYRDAADNQLFLVFCQGSDNNHLWVNSFDGLSWNWIDQGMEAGPPFAVTYRDAAGHQRFSVFCQGSNNNHLWVNSFDGSSWQWYDQGLPQGTSSIAVCEGAITYTDAAGLQHFFVFCLSGNGHQVINWFDGFNWHWTDTGP